MCNVEWEKYAYAMFTNGTRQHEPTDCQASDNFFLELKLLIRKSLHLKYFLSV